jgi:hypothetical protein
MIDYTSHINALEFLSTGSVNRREYAALLCALQLMRELQSAQELAAAVARDQDSATVKV